MILVTGASGKLGGHVVESLLQRLPASEIVAGARHLEKAQRLATRGVRVRHLDYNKEDSVTAALSGIDRVVLVSGFEPNRVEQHRTVIAAARRAGVRLLAYTSGLRADVSKIRIIEDHRATEQLLKESGLPFVALRNSWYVENYTDNVGPLLQHGTMPGAAGEGRVSVAPRSDYAEAAAVVISTEGHAGKTYELGGDQAHTLAEIASEIARVTGKRLVYQNLSEAEYAATLSRFGVPEAYARALADADAGLERGELMTDSKDLSGLLGRPTTALSVAIERAFKKS